MFGEIDHFPETIDDNNFGLLFTLHSETFHDTDNLVFSIATDANVYYMEWTLFRLSPKLSGRLHIL